MIAVTCLPKLRLALGGSGSPVALGSALTEAAAVLISRAFSMLYRKSFEMAKTPSEARLLPVSTSQVVVAFLIAP